MAGHLFKNPSNQKMKSFKFLTTLLVFSCASAYAEKNLFDGKTLKGWDGDPKFWSVKDGAIVGQTSKENPTKGNTFIICKDLKMKDCVIPFIIRMRTIRDGYLLINHHLHKQCLRVSLYQLSF